MSTILFRIVSIFSLAKRNSLSEILGDNKIWHSHGRSIGVEALTHILKLKIEDYSNDPALTKIIREYNDLICQYIGRNNGEMFFHTRKFI